MKPNSKQQAIIDAVNVNLIVSASAGTGKTATMTNRIVKLVNEGVNLDNMLIVTFTKLAAIQMKQRISDSLTDNIDNDSIRMQLQLIDSFKISTLHSMCADIIRNFFYIVDTDPCFEIASDSERDRLQKLALDKLMDNHYKLNDINELVNMLCGRQDDKLREIIIQLFEFSCCIPDIDKWLNESLKLYDNNYFATLINRNLCNITNNYKSYLADCIYQCKEYGLTALLDYTCDISDEINTSIRKDLQHNVDNIINMKFANKSNKLHTNDSSYKCDIDTFTSLVNKIEQIKSNLKNLKKQTAEEFDTSINLMLDRSLSTRQTLRQLIELTKEFNNIYSEMKLNTGLLDYNDLEHLCLEILKYDTVRQLLKSKYQYIFVDEYQDINYVQESIIEALKSEQNIFYVGDIKQSIYSFRQCQVQIFINKLTQYSEDNSINQTHRLTTNYRSNRQIINFVNSVFNKLMTKQFGGVDYINEQLDCNEAISDVCSEEEKVTVTIINNKDSDETSVVGIDIVNKIAGIVGTSVNGKFIKYSDIAIITRSHANAQKIYDVLAANLIPTIYEGQALSLDTVECSTVCQMCSLIDNINDDINLVAILSGFIGGLNNQQLADIRLEGSGSFYNNCINYCTKHNDEISNKLNKLFNLIKKYSLLSHSLKVDQLLSKLIDETNFSLYVLGLPNGKARFNKLINLINSLKDKPYNYSVSKFVDYCITNNSLTLAADNREVSNAVSLMTIHKSKGLEFEIVFVAGLETKFIKDNDSVICLYNGGLAMNYYDINGRSTNNTLSYLALNKTKNDLNMQEELRLMYVAFTRAKSKLFISAVIQKNTLITDVNEANCMCDWITLVLNDTAISSNINLIKIDADQLQKNTAKSKIISYTQPTKQEVDEVMYQLNYKYPYLKETVSPYKVVSSMLDYHDSDTPYFTVALADASAYGAEIGIAYHKVMETYDYQNHYNMINNNTDGDIENDSAKRQVAEHIDKLVKSNKLNKDVAAKLNINLILNCINNKEFNQLINSGKQYHEIPFMYSYDYGLINRQSKSDTDTVVQGVIDLLIINNNSATIIDFKYIKSSQLLEQRYKLQLNSYYYAVKNILKFDKIDCYIFSIADNKLVKII